MLGFETKRFSPGDVVYKKIDGERIIVLKELEVESEETPMGKKFLVRNGSNKKFVLHEIELVKESLFSNTPKVTY